MTRRNTKANYFQERRARFETTIGLYEYNNKKNKEKVKLSS
jgi:hypothetical protein